MISLSSLLPEEDTMTLPKLPTTEGSVLHQTPLHKLAKEIVKVIDRFFKNGSDHLEKVVRGGYKVGEFLDYGYIDGKDWGGNTTLFLIYPSANHNPDTRTDAKSPDYISKSAGYFTTLDQGPQVGIMGKIVLHLDMFIPIFTNYNINDIPSSEYDIRDPKTRKDVYKKFKRELYQFAFHEAQHAVKRFIHGWSGKSGLGTKYQKYFGQVPGDQSLSQYANIGDEWESILAQIMSELQSTIRFEKDRPEQLKTLTKTLITSPSFRRLVNSMLDRDRIGKDTQDGKLSPKSKEFFQPIWTSSGPRVITKLFDPFHPDYFKYIHPKYQRMFKTMLKKLVEWWRAAYPKKSFRTPVDELLNKNETLYIGWVNKINLKVIGFSVQSGEDETHHNYLMGLPTEWKNEYDSNLIRWRYRRDMNVIYWWEFSNPTDNEKQSVEMWVKDNLTKQPPEHRIIPTNRDNMSFWKSHGEDECVKQEDGDEWPSLNEDMTFRDLMGVSDPNRVSRADTVNARSLRVRSIDEYEAWTFSYKSNPSDSRPKNAAGTSPRWQGYVKFLKDDVKSGEDAQEINCHVDCTCPDYVYRWAYNNAQVNAGKIGQDSWNKCVNRSPKINLGQGLCKHLISLEGYLQTKIYKGEPGTKSNLFESQDLYKRFDQFVKENVEFDVPYEDDTGEEVENLNESFRNNKEWFIYDGVRDIKVVFKDGRQLTFEIDYKGNLGINRESWRNKSVSVLRRIATEIYKNPDITEVGNIKQVPWYECFKEAMLSREMYPFRLPDGASKITFEKKITGYEKAPKISAGLDSVNFTPRTV